MFLNMLNSFSSSIILNPQIGQTGNKKEFEFFCCIDGPVPHVIVGAAIELFSLRIDSSDFPLRL